MGNHLLYQKLSIIVPTLNEAGQITETLSRLQGARRAGHELIVVDGGSSDDTVAQAKSYADQVISADPGRARQMNAAAAVAAGEVLWFVHADTEVKPTAFMTVAMALNESQACWGRFDVRLSGQKRLLRLVAMMMNLRSRWSGIATGDQALFIRRSCFDQVGGFDDIPLMEDIAISRKLKSLGPPLCLREKLTTSSRRWEKNGVIRTILLMWRLRFDYWRGVDPHALVKRYYR